MDRSQKSNQCSRLYIDGNGPSSLGFHPGMLCFQGTSLEVRSGMVLHDLRHLPLNVVHLTCCVSCWLCDIPWHQGPPVLLQVQCPSCLPSVLFRATATQNPVHYACLEWVYRSCPPEWARCWPLLPCGPVGGVMKDGDTGPFRSSYKTLVLRRFHRCDKLSSVAKRAVFLSVPFDDKPDGKLDWVQVPVKPQDQASWKCC